MLQFAGLVGGTQAGRTKTLQRTINKQRKRSGRRGLENVVKEGTSTLTGLMRASLGVKLAMYCLCNHERATTAPHGVSLHAPGLLGCPTCSA